MINFFTFDGENSKDYGVFISGAGTFNAPERNVTTVEVAGRNGNLTIDDGTYKNVPLSYPAFIYKDFKTRVEAFRNVLLSRKGYKRLEDTYNPDEYRMARFSGSFETEPVDELYGGNFTINFDCMPQRFLKSGEKAVEVATGDKLCNPTLQTAKPLVTCYGNGTLTINDIDIVVTGVTDYINIDCDLQEAYHGDLSSPMNSNITLSDGAFFELTSGENVITFSGFSKVEIVPRWWIV